MSDTPLDIACRPAALDDVEAIAEIHVAAFESHYRGVLGDDVLDARGLDMRRRMWTKALSEPPRNHFVTVAELDGTLVGFCTAEPSWYEDHDPEKVINLNRMYLKPGIEGRGARGVGQALYNDQEARWIEQGFEACTGQIGSTNERSSRFFQRQGWQYDGHERTVEDGSIERRIGKPLHRPTESEPDRG